MEGAEKDSDQKIDIVLMSGNRFWFRGRLGRVLMKSKR
jgi:hypothetical protein